jgi:hypothetical protein
MYRLLTHSKSTPPPSQVKPQPWFRLRHKPWQPHIKKIILACGLVVIPMIAFTITLLCIVFSKIVSLDRCPYPDLCPTNSTDSAYYYVDFPVGRLAFVSSLSSTISFALMAALMTMYGFIAARRLLSASESTEALGYMPSSFEISVLVRLLNAEMFPLLEMFVQIMQRPFRRRSSHDLELLPAQIVTFARLFSSSLWRSLGGSCFFLPVEKVVC